MPSRSASSAPSPESPPEQVRIPSPRPRGRAPRTASALASSSRSWTSSAHAAPASRASARNTRWSPASAPVWAAAAAAPTADAPTFRTATPTPASAHAASASHSAAPSPASSMISATDRSSGSVARWASQSAVRQHRLVPGRDRGVEAEPAAGGERVDDEVAALRDQPDVPRLGGRAARRPTARPGSGARRARRSWGRRRGASGGGPPRGGPLRGWRRPTAVPRGSRRHKTTAPPHPIAPASSITPGTAAAGMATTTASGADGRSASAGKHGKPWASERLGLTPQTSPPNPTVRRLRSVWEP